MGKGKVVQWPFPQQAASSKGKSIPPTQAAVDALPYGSGTWRVEGSMGLYVRCRAKTKSFMVQRKVGGRLVQKVLGEMTLAQARRQAQKIWQSLKPSPPGGKLTLGQAWQAYLDEHQLAPKTRALYEYNLRRYLADWTSRTLEQIGNDRAGLRSLYQRLVRTHGLAIAAQVMRMFSAVYRYARRVNLDLPPCPTEVVDVVVSKPRDWALSDDQLKDWWRAVSRLNPLKRTFWLVLLYTGARRGSVEALRWADVDFEQGVIAFSVAKAGRTYAVPISRHLKEILLEWRGQASPGEEWVFPSPRRPGQHITAARDEKRGVASAHHLRHTYRTVLARLGCPPDTARAMLGHSFSGDVSRGYITLNLLLDALRPWAEAVAEHYGRVLKQGGEDGADA